MSVNYLPVRQVTEINKQLIKRYSPKEISGVKDHHMLASAVNRPQHSVFGEDAYPTIELKAASLFQSLALNHAFHNANKRTAFLALYVFLGLNGYALEADEQIAEDFTVQMVAGKPAMTVEEIAEWIVNHSRKR